MYIDEISHFVNVCRGVEFPRSTFQDGMRALSVVEAAKDSMRRGEQACPRVLQYTLAIVQARMGSKRLPGKVLADLDGTPALKFMLDRLSACSRVDKIVIAVPYGERDDILCEQVHSWGFDVFRGSEQNVLQRFKDCASRYGADKIVRLTGDCPFIDPTMVDSVVYSGESVYTGHDVADGFDVQAFSVNELAKSQDKDHVVSGLPTWDTESNDGDVRLTLDTPEDLKTIRALLPILPYRFSYDQAVKAYRENPDKVFNRHLSRKVLT